jgi:hypothetical protein
MPSKAKAKAGARRIDFGKIRWGAFTAQFKAYRARHPASRLKTLRAYAEYILRHPSRHTPLTRKRALFYLNVILKGGVKREPGARPKGGKKGAKRSSPGAKRVIKREG